MPDDRTDVDAFVKAIRDGEPWLAEQLWGYEPIRGGLGYVMAVAMLADLQQQINELKAKLEESGRLRACNGN